MPSPYIGVPFNGGFLRRPSITEPVDADPRNAASIDPLAVEPLTDWAATAQQTALNRKLSSWTPRATNVQNPTAAFSIGSRAFPNPSQVRYLILGVTGGHVIESSVDGITWTTRSSVGVSFYGADYSPSLGLWVAVGGTNAANAGQIYSSPDGITWTARLTTATHDLYSVAWSTILSLFVAVGHDGTTAYFSANGTVWTAVATNYTGGTPLRRVEVLGIGRFVAFPLNNGSTNYVTSDAGNAAWIQRALPGGAGNSDAFTGARAFGVDCTDLFLVDHAKAVWHSVDGIAWTNLAANLATLIGNLGLPGTENFETAIGGGYTFACNEQSLALLSQSDRIYASIDGVHWSLQASPDPNNAYPNDFGSIVGDELTGVYLVTSQILAATAGGVFTSLYGLGP